MKKKPSAFLVRMILVNTVLMVLVGIYLVASIFGKVPMTGTVFMVLMVILAFCNLLFIGSLWRKRAQLSVLAKMMAVFWGWFVFWFWVFAPPYFLLVMNVDALQLRWVIFAFTWEVVFMGAAYVYLCSYLFKPVQRFIESSDAEKKEISKSEAAKLYQRGIRYPAYAALMIVGFSSVGFVSGEMQVRLFGMLPFIEGIKNYCIGFVAAIFLAVIYYVTIRSLLDPVCSELEEKAGIEKGARSTIASRVLLVSVLVVVGSLFLLQLIVVKSFQNIVRDEVVATLSEDINNDLWNTDIQRHGTILLDPDSTALTKLSVSSDTQAEVFSESSGIVDDFQDRLKLVGFFTDPTTGQKSVAVVPLDNYYGPLGPTIFSFLIGAFFVLFVGLGIASIAALALTRSIRVLIKAIRMLDTNPKAAMPQIATGDEIEELAEALGYFVRQSQRLDQEKDEFISIASHHLRTPVTEMGWLIESLEKGDIRENITAYLPDIKASAAHMAELVKMLLDVHRFDGVGEMKKAENCELVNFVRKAVEKYQLLAHRRGVTIQFSAPERLDIVTDLTFMNIIVESLLSNAVEYTLKDGRVSVTLTDEGKNLKLVVSDTGIGIAEEEKEHIFNKFMRAANARVVKPNGTGLGLYVAKQSVLKLGGTISFESAVGKGTTFEVILPKTL